MVLYLKLSARNGNKKYSLKEINEKQASLYEHLESPYLSLAFWKWMERFSLSINTVSATSPP